MPDQIQQFLAATTDFTEQHVSANCSLSCQLLWQNALEEIKWGKKSPGDSFYRYVFSFSIEMEGEETAKSHQSSFSHRISRKGRKNYLHWKPGAFVLALYPASHLSVRVQWNWCDRVLTNNNTLSSPNSTFQLLTLLPIFKSIVHIYKGMWWSRDLRMYAIKS